jgi:hypothetical protein
MVLPRPRNIHPRDSPMEPTIAGLVVCDVGNTLWRCNEHSAHQTNLGGGRAPWGLDYTFKYPRPGTKAALLFYGSGISLLDNATLGMCYIPAVDVQEMTASP